MKRMIASIIMMLLLIICGVMPAGAYAAEKSEGSSAESVSIDLSDLQPEQIREDIDQDLLARYMASQLEPASQSACSSSVYSSLRNASGDSGLRSSSGAGGLRGASRGSRLSGADAVIYDKLAESIRMIAAGEQLTAIVTIPFTDLLEQEMYTAEDLGLQRLSDDDDMLTDEAKTAFRSLCEFSLESVFYSLIEDMPYELYWFDKQNNEKSDQYSEDSSRPKGSLSYSTTYSFKRDPDGSISCISRDSSRITFKFAVSADYSASGSTGTYDLREDLSRVRTAIANASQIISDHAAEADVRKLDSYREEICSMTKYNKSAFDGMNSGTFNYGDPWQLIYVFDGDSRTDVVCEGYAKALKFLCDNSVFYSDIECYTVTGSTGSGRHMWNILRMNDGSFYLADVTNCDGSNIGNPDRLFLKGCTGGSVIKGYKYPGIKYTYDAYTLLIFGKSELTMSGADYKCKHKSSYWTAATNGTRKCRVCGIKDPSREYKADIAPKYTPSKTAITGFTAGKGKVRIAWKRLAKKTQSYQIQIRSRKTGRIVKTITVSQGSGSIMKKTVSGLKRMTDYRIRIRAVNKAAGYTFCGAWSAYKNFTTR